MEKTIQPKQKTKSLLEDTVKALFFPKGWRELMEEMNTRLELGPVQSSVNKVAGICVDVIKYPAYASLIYGIIKDIY